MNGLSTYVATGAGACIPDASDCLHRSGVLSAEELDGDYEDEVEFLMAKLKRLKNMKVGRLVR